MGRITTLFIFLVFVLGPCRLFPQGVPSAMSDTELSVRQKVQVLQTLAAKEKKEGRSLNAFNQYLSAMRLLPPASACSPEFLEFSFAAEMNVISFVDSLMIEFRNTGSRITLSRFVFPVYEHAISTAYRMYAVTGKKDYFDKAFILAEKSKNLRVVEALRNSGASSLAGVPAWLSNTFIRLSSSLEKCQLRYDNLKTSGQANNTETIKRLADTLALLRQKNDSLSFYIYNKYPAYLGMMNRRDFINADNVRKGLLNDSTALLAYFYGDSTLYLFLVTTKKESVVRISRKDFPDTLVLAFQKAIITHDFKKFCASASKLYDLLFKPAELMFDGTGRVIIIPDGILGYLPFECLIRTSKHQAKKDYKSLDYLVRHFTFSYAPSATALLLNQTLSPIRIKPAFHFFAPLYDENLKSDFKKIRKTASDSIYLGLAAQPWSRELSVELKKVYPGEYYLGNAANISAFRKCLAKSGIIHIAAHTLFNDEDAMNSRIVFAKEMAGDSVTADGYLHAYDLFGLKSGSSLVVLASCRTGFGTFERCEGISGLAMGFSYAGCPSLIYTLWEVDEKATNQLMLSFYTALQQGIPIDRALREAQLTYLKESNEISADPYYWAGLLASGDCRPFSFEQGQKEFSGRLIFSAILLLIAFTFTFFIIFRRRQGLKSKRFL